MSKQGAKEVIDRIKQVFNVTKDSELGVLLDIPSQNFSTWRQRDAVPFELCIELAREKRINLNWLLNGDGAMYLDDNVIKETKAGYQLIDESKLLKRIADIEQKLDKLGG